LILCIRDGAFLYEVPKFVVALLVVALSGANSGLASICAAYCMSSPSAASAAVHSHQTKSQAGSASTGQNIRGHHSGAECPECPPNSGKSLNQKADCASLIQIQTLKQDSFNLNVPNAIAHFDAADMPVHAVGLPGNGERSLDFDASRSIRSFPSSSPPLRI
jgi:hypothetical protein